VYKIPQIYPSQKAYNTALAADSCSKGSKMPPLRSQFVNQERMKPPGNCRTIMQPVVRQEELRACEETTMPIIPKGPLTENVGKRIKGQPANPDSAENVH